MSVSTCIKCDGPTCKEQLHHHPDLVAYPQDWHLPDGWLTLVPGDTQLHSAWHFCSRSCLHNWIEQENIERMRVPLGRRKA